MSPENIISKLQDMSLCSSSEERVFLEAVIALIKNLGIQMQTLKNLASKNFRASSEKLAPGQMAFNFLQFIMSSSQEEESHQDPDKQEISVVSVKPEREKRTSKIHLLPVEAKQKELSEEERSCGSCGEIKAEIGVDVSRQIIHEPARLFMLEEHLHKYACRNCREGVVCGAATPKPIEGGLVSSSLLAHIVVAKVVDAIPVERLGRMLERHGAHLAPSTLHDWFGAAGDMCLFLEKHIKGHLLQSQLISLDDTPLPAKNAAERKGLQKGRLWLYLGDVGRFAYCEFTSDWKGIHPRTVLGDFEGTIQADGYAGINPLFEKNKNLKHAGCNDHARRKFVDALKLGDKRVEYVLLLFQKLYAVERDAKSLSLKPPEILLLRQEKSQAVWNDMDKEISVLTLTAEPKTPLYRAVTYWHRQRTSLGAFLGNGYLPISNAHVERLLRMVALMRKNSLYTGSIDAGKRYATLLTLALNCILLGANPYHYFCFLFQKIAENYPANKRAELLPHIWVEQQS